MKSQTTRATNMLTVTSAGGLHCVTLASASEATGLHEGMILEFVRGHLVPPAPQSAPGDLPVFDEHGLCRLRQIAELRDRHHVNLRTVKLIVRLMDRLEQAETELRFLREQGRAGSL